MTVLAGSNFHTPQRLIRVSEQLSAFNLDFEDLIIHSRTQVFEKHVPDSGLSIKLGHIGEEHFFIDGQRHSIGPNEYLLVNRHQAFDCYLKSPTPVEGFCLYLGQPVIQEAAALLLRTEESLLDLPDASAEAEPSFLEKVYRTSENELGQYLEWLRPRMASGEGIDFNRVFFDTATVLLRSHWKIQTEMQGIACSRKSTREELYRRLCIARTYIFDHYRQDIQLEELSRVAMLSKYHLLRSYKQAFNITPYQQVLEMRLAQARELVLQGGNLENIAQDLGFSDRRSFTKAFKRAYGMAPSHYREHC